MKKIEKCKRTLGDFEGKRQSDSSVAVSLSFFILRLGGVWYELFLCRQMSRPVKIVGSKEDDTLC